jgi:hypothetical protein
MMAPDSKRVTEVLGSSMAGTRPLGLTDSKGSGLGGVRRVWVLGCCWIGSGFWEGLRTLVEDAEVHEFGLVGDVQLVEDDGYFPWVGALGGLSSDNEDGTGIQWLLTYASVAVELERLARRHDYNDIRDLCEVVIVLYDRVTMLKECSRAYAQLYTSRRHLPST